MHLVRLAADAIRRPSRDGRDRAPQATTKTATVS
jgi:hypothetical protein